MLPQERTLRSRKAAHSLHAKYDSTKLSQPARDAFMARFEREADPDGSLDPVERTRRAEHLRKAYFLGLALKSAKARRKRAET